MLFLSKGVKNKIRNLSDFIRFEISFFSIFIALLGYILFNAPVGISVLAIGISTFCAIAFCFAYNNTKDVEEDSINRKQLSSLTNSLEGKLVLISLITIGFISSLFLPIISTIFYLLMIAVGTVYSFFTLNSRTFSHLIKNFYASFGLSMIFFLGAGGFNLNILFYYFLFSVLIFAGSIVADLRDYDGDSKTGKRSLPTVLGYNKSKIISSIIFFSFALLVFQLSVTTFFIFAIISFLLIFLVLIDKPQIAHRLAAVSVMLNTSWLWIIS